MNTGMAPKSLGIVGAVALAGLVVACSAQTQPTASYPPPPAPPAYGSSARQPQRRRRRWATTRRRLTFTCAPGRATAPAFSGYCRLARWCRPADRPTAAGGKCRRRREAAGSTAAIFPRPDRSSRLRRPLIFCCRSGRAALSRGGWPAAGPRRALALRYRRAELAGPSLPPGRFRPILRRGWRARQSVPDRGSK
jgi:hypothetical protein